MIAYLGEKMFISGVRHGLEDTVIDQRFRTDQEKVVWKEDRKLGRISTPGTRSLDIGGIPSIGDVLGRGAEAITTYQEFGHIPAVRKYRYPKGYRLSELESRLTTYRIRNEARMLRSIRSAGVRTPYVLDVDMEGNSLVMELLEGPRLASILNVLDEEKQRDAMRMMGHIIGSIHSGGMVHGDLTTSNFILTSLENGLELGMIDCSLSERTEELEKMGVDLRLFFEVFTSTHPDLLPMEKEFWEGYDQANPHADRIRNKLDEITRRGRYLTERWAT
jgi:Kae1-associated kinase Bud32